LKSAQFSRSPDISDIKGQSNDMSNSAEGQLKKILTPFMVWGLGVGYVISGNYFGWNLGLEKGGTLGLAVAVFFIIILYVTFTFSYAELSCALPKAGGAFDYATRAYGKDVGFIAGMAQNIEFIFAPPAIAFAIGAYLNLFFQSTPVLLIAIGAYAVFTLLNISGIQAAARFELIITILAVSGLVLFSIVTFSHFNSENLTRNALPNGWSGVFAAVPFAIWFFLGIEGVANVAEETINPKRTILLGFGSSIVTLVLLCMVTFCGAVGVAGWEKIVYTPEGVLSDSPLPLAMGYIVGTDNILYYALIGVGLFGLVASFNGLILAAGRSTFEFGRVKFAPAFLGNISPRFQTPKNALLVNMLIGIVALLTGRTAEIITLAVFGALTLYIIAMLTMLRLRKTEPELPRPFVVPGFPWVPRIALTISIASFLALAIYNVKLAGIYFLITGTSFLIFKVWNRTAARN
jgi:ethanolamine permease